MKNRWSSTNTAYLRQCEREMRQLDEAYTNARELAEYHNRRMAAIAKQQDKLEAGAQRELAALQVLTALSHKESRP
jgi:hypothetical protein